MAVLYENNVKNSLVFPFFVGQIIWGFMMGGCGDVLRWLECNGACYACANFVTPAYIIFSYICVFKASNSLSTVGKASVYLFLSIYLVCSVLFFYLMGVYSPLVFMGLFFYTGLIDGVWLVNAPVQAFSSFFGI